MPRRDLAHLSDEAVVALTARSDEVALAELYDRYGRPAYGLALRVLRDEALAEDAVQDAFLAIWRGASRFIPEKAKASTWIMTLVHRRAVDLVRREERRRADPLPDTEPVSGGPSAADSAWLHLERERVQAALGAASRRPAGGDRARLLRRLHAIGACRAAGRAARHHKEQDVRRPLAAARASRDTLGRRSMETDSIHDLSAAYALDALDAGERRGLRGTSRGLRALPRGGRRVLGRGRGARLRSRPGGAVADAPRPDPRRGAGGAAQRRPAPAALGLPGRSRRRRGGVRGDRARDLERLPPRTGSRTPRRCRASR